MNRKIYILLALLITGTALFVSSCSKDDDNKVDQDWKTFQETEFQKVAKNTEYTEVASETGNGSIYWQNSSVITDSDLASRITTSGTPEFTDTVSVRYEGWYYQLDGTKYIFDSTEGPTNVSTTNPNKVAKQFAVNAVIDGWTTALQRMHEGDEKLVVIPQQLGYGSSAQTYIPAYTTLWFRIKLVKIISIAGRN